MTGRFRFPRCRRIRSGKDFRRVFRRRCRVGDRHLVLYVERSEMGYTRLGISAGKGLGNAVVRTREKRRLREAFRLHQHELAALDMVCVLKTKGHRVAEYAARLIKLAGEAQRKLERA